ncbi:DEAD/DEAH box helicase [Geoalkalibacter sp.]|uniref:DEAD/DEAH box helicase n=1 Tax=Geoalkalibacter sp. TaxID=3041440 RepID=UPI00272E433A|nr:DEAD/DEAH box helicase [Geoalkalibacter sp.]
MTHIVPSTETPLVGALRELPVSSLYTLGGKDQLIAALRLCQVHAVRPPEWARGRTQLSVDVVDEQVREVTLALKDGRIDTQCECRLTGPRACAHRLAALLTLKKALSPQTVSGWNADARQLENIRTALLAAPKTRAVSQPAARKKTPAKRAAAPKTAAAEFSVVLTPRFGMVAIEVARNGSAVAPYARGVPKPLQPLLESPWLSRAHPEAVLCALLDQRGMEWPVQVRDDRGKLRPLRIEPPETRQGLLCLDAREDGLHVARVLDDGSRLGGNLLWLGSWAADVEQERLVRVRRPEIWSLWPSLMEAAEPLTGKEGYRIPWKNFYGLEFLSEAHISTLDECLLHVDGVPQVPAPTLLTDYQVDITLSADDEAQLLAGTRHGSCKLILDPRALSLFTEDYFERTSAPLRALKRRRVLYETFFAARRAATKTERQRILREAIAGPDFRKRVLVREAREHLENLVTLDRHSSRHLNVIDGRWVLLERDRDREAQLLELLYRRFGDQALRGALVPGEFHLKRKALFAALPDLVAELSACGVELRLGGRPARPAQLDINIATTAKDIDWFELRPEIRCEGALLDESLWRQALAEGIFAAGGQLHLLTDRDREALRILAGLGDDKARKRRELVRVPRLHILDLLALRKLGATLRLDPEDEAILNRLENFDGLPCVQLPKLQAALRDYQQRGYEWLSFLYQHKFGACLADDMGLGKTIQAISLLAALHQQCLPARAGEAPHLVVVPPSLLFNWESEITRFAPDLRTLVYRGLERSTDFSGVDVVLTSYEIVRRDIEALAAIDFHVLIFDEAQAVKNVHAAVTGAVRRLRGAFKLALTGTPVENHLGEYWSIIDLVLPGLLGPYRRFGNGRGETDQAELRLLIARTRPFVLRRTKEKIAAELPDKVEIDLHLDLTDEQKILYQNTVAAVRAEVAAAWREHNTAQARITTLAALTRLRRLCLDPRLGGGKAATGEAPKITALCEHLEELQAEGHSTLVFSQFTSFLDLVEPALHQRNIPFVRLDGGTPVTQRRKLVETFQNSREPLVFLLSLKAGGRGLNLTRATYVVHLDPWWNPAVENQASDRAHRIGQTRKVTVLRLLMRHTVEEKMMLLKERKQRLFQALLDEGRDGGGVPLTREDFEFLVGE